MLTLKKVLSIEQSRMFVGRKPEIELMKSWLEQENPPTEIVFISGIGGIGKSTLLLRFLNMAQDEHRLCIWLDGRSCTSTPDGFLEAIYTFLIQKVPGYASEKTSITDIATFISEQSTVLCVDNFEHLHRINGWLREVFLPELSASDLLVIFVARQELGMEWKNHLAWRNRIRYIRLTPISSLEAREYFTLVGLDIYPELDNLIYETKGLPLAMALSAERFKLPLHHSPTSWPISHLVSAELLREVVSSDLQEIIDLLCILPQSNVELLSELLHSSISNQQLHELSRLSFVRPTVDGFALHDVARVHLLEQFMQREPSRYHKLCLRIAHEVIRQLNRADIQYKKRMAADLLSICRDYIQVDSKKIISINPSFTKMESYRHSDLPHLHNLINKQKQGILTLESGAHVHQLLDALGMHFPESIQVFRSADGKPLAFTAGLLLYQDTIAFLEPFVPQVLENCFPSEIEQMRQLQLNEADTYYLLLTASTKLDPQYPFYELNGILLAEGFSRNSTVGMRSILVTN